MELLLVRMSLFFLGGALIASMVSGNPAPFLVTIVAVYILWRVFNDRGPGGSPRPPPGRCQWRRKPRRWR